MPLNQDTAIIFYPKYFLLNLMGLRIFDPIILITQAEVGLYCSLKVEQGVSLKTYFSCQVAVFKTIFVVDNIFYILRAPF